MSLHLGLPVLLLAYLLFVSGPIGSEADLSPIPAHGVDQLEPISTHEFDNVSLFLDFQSMIDWNALPNIRREDIDDETLWLARCIYSETKDVREMELVAWVVRNRVETSYRGKDSYREVVLDPYQFSAFNDTSRVKFFYSDLSPTARFVGWKDAIKIAHTIRNAPAELRPFSKVTRHFYSERSMKGRRHPVWALGNDPVQVGPHYELDELRFRFFEGIS